MTTGGDFEIRAGTGAETLHLFAIEHYAAGRGLESVREPLNTDSVTVIGAAALTLAAMAAALSRRSRK